MIDLSWITGEYGWRYYWRWRRLLSLSWTSIVLDLVSKLVDEVDQIGYLPIEGVNLRLICLCCHVELLTSRSRVVRVNFA